MSDPSEMKARHEAALGRLAELGLALAEDLQARALAVEEPEMAARLADSFHKVARGVRQTLALEARLAREAVKVAREVAVEDERTRPLRIAKRQVEVRKAVERMIWTEVENDEDAEDAVGMLADLMDGDDVLDDDFVDAPLEVVIQRFRDRLFQELADYLAADLDADAAADPGPAEPELRNSA